MKNQRKSNYAIKVLAFCLFCTSLGFSINSIGLAQQLNENCTVSILNRTTQVQTDGSWQINNIPANLGSVRARATCIQDGTFLNGQSDFFQIPANEVIGISQGLGLDISLGGANPIPESLTVTSPIPSLPSVGATAQLTVTANFSDGANGDVTPESTGTNYTVTNPAVATVSSDGLVTAVSSGTVFISASNEGALGLLQIQVVLSGDSDGDGIPDDIELLLGLNPTNPVDALEDFDGDGLTNLEEVNVGSNINLVDSDMDGLTDPQEIALQTFPAIPDSDGDGLLDGEEVALGTEPLIMDTDTDGLDDGVEADLVARGFFCIHPLSQDFNNNGILDPFEDCDGDGFTNIEEVQRESDLGEFNFQGFFIPDDVISLVALAGGDSQLGSFPIFSFGTDALEWNAMVDMSWVLLGPSGGFIPPETRFPVPFSVDPSGLMTGIHNATITVNAPAVVFSQTTYMVPVTLVVLEDSARGRFFAGQLLEADVGFQAILDGDPTNAEAHFFRALTRLFRLFEETQDGPDPSVFTDSLKEMLDRFGFDSIGRRIINGTAESPKNSQDEVVFPDDSPTGKDIQTFLAAVGLPEVMASIEEDLQSLDPTFELTLTEAELTAFEITGEGPIEVDYGDVKLLESAFQTAKAALFLSQISEGDFDTDNILNNQDTISLQAEVIDADPALFTLKPDAVQQVSDAEVELKNAIQSYQDASAFIRAEVDNQNDDLIMIDPRDLQEEEVLRTRLTEIQASLDGQAFIEDDLVDLSLFFDTPFDLRGLLPTIGFDSNREPTNFIEAGTFPDPTFNGMLPNMTPQRLEELLDVIP